MPIAYDLNKQVAVFDGTKFDKCIFIKIDDTIEIEDTLNGVLISVDGSKFVKVFKEDPGFDSDSIYFLLIDFTKGSKESQVIGCATKAYFYEDPTPNDPIFFV